MISLPSVLEADDTGVCVQVSGLLFERSQTKLKKAQVWMARRVRKLEPIPYEKWSKDQGNLIWEREELSLVL